MFKKKYVKDSRMVYNFRPEFVVQIHAHSSG